MSPGLQRVVQARETPLEVSHVYMIFKARDPRSLGSVV